MPAEVMCTAPCVCYLAQHPGLQSAGKQGGASAQRGTWEDNYSVVLLIIFKPECISTWYFFLLKKDQETGR